MRVLFFSMYMIRGGAERVISTLCNGKFGKCSKSYILTVIKGDSEYKLIRDVKHFGLITKEDYFSRGRLKTLPEVCKKYYWFVKKMKPDVILSFLPEPCFIAGLYRNVLGIPVIGSERGNPYYQFRNPVYKIAGNWLYARADGFVFQTEGARNFFCSKIRRNSVIIGNPVIHEELPDLRMDERNKEIAAVGRFTDEKNYTMLIRVFARVVKVHPEFRLRIFGKYEENDEAVILISRLGLKDSVILEGQTEDVKQKIYKAYAFILTSLSEGLPNALMEAMSAGLPVIATDCPAGGPRQLIKDGVNGILIENDNEEAAVSAVLRLIDDPELAGRLGREAKKIEDEYAEVKIADMWMRYIKQIKLVSGKCQG